MFKAIGGSGFSNDDDYKEPIFKEALTRSKTHRGPRPDYVDWDPVLKPEFQKEAKPAVQRRPKSPEPLDFFKYEKDYDYDAQPVQRTALATEDPEWYEATGSDEHTTPVNVTWDGKSWPDKVERRVRNSNQDSGVDDNAYLPERRPIGCIRD